MCFFILRLDIDIVKNCRTTSKSFGPTTHTLPRYAPSISSSASSAPSSATDASRPSCSSTASYLAPSLSISSVQRRRSYQVGKKLMIVQIFWPSPEWSNALIAMSAGLLFGLITMLVQYVGLFMLGFHTGHYHDDNGDDDKYEYNLYLVWIVMLLQWFCILMLLSKEQVSFPLFFSFSSIFAYRFFSPLYYRHRGVEYLLD